MFALLLKFKDLHNSVFQNKRRVVFTMNLQLASELQFRKIAVNTVKRGSLGIGKNIFAPQ